MEGYLVFTTHDGDELDATFLEKNPKNTKLFKSLVNCHYDNDEAMQIWSDFTAHDEYKMFSAQAPGEAENWPFNGYKIIGAYYLLVY